MEQHHPVRLQELFNGPKELVIAGRADMLEHPHRTYGQIFGRATGSRAVRSAPGRPAPERARARWTPVLLGESVTPVTLTPVVLGQEQPSPAPAGADVEHLLAGRRSSFAAMWRFLAHCASSMDASGRSKYAQEYCMSRSRKSR
jgi:hypothetical protein